MRPLDDNLPRAAAALRTALDAIIEERADVDHGVQRMEERAELRGLSGQPGPYSDTTGPAAVAPVPESPLQAELRELRRRAGVLAGMEQALREQLRQLAEV